MRILLGVPWYFPDSVGGTEVYVHGLARQLRKSGIDVAVAAPTRAATPDNYVHEGVRVFRFPSPDANVAEIHIDRAEPSGWSDVLDAFQPTVVDLHALTSGLELAHLKAAHRRGEDERRERERADTEEKFRAAFIFIPAFATCRTSSTRSSTWVLADLISTGGSMSPVGRMICSAKTPPVCAISHEPGVAET